MVHETASIEPMEPAETQEPAFPTSPAPQPLPLAWLALSVGSIALGAVLFSSLLAVITLLIFYAQVGADGVADFYQELRFDIPLKTQIGATVVSTLYVGVALATIAAAALRGRHGWAALVALSPIRGGRRPAVGIFFLTIAYAATATLTMTLLQEHRFVASGPTDFALLWTITANLVILAPCAEELFFRGWLYTALRCRLTFWPSYVITASLFAAIHWDVNHRRVFLVLPLALALGLLREMTGSIKPTIALHATYNLIIVGITLLEA